MTIVQVFPSPGREETSDTIDWLARADGLAMPAATVISDHAELVVLNCSRWVRCAAASGNIRSEGWSGVKKVR